MQNASYRRCRKCFSGSSISLLYIYQNFPDISAVIHAHPIFIMAFGAAHMDLSAIIGGTRAILGNHPVSNMPEVMPGSVEQATEIVENFKKRREIDIEPTNLWTSLSRYFCSGCYFK